MAIMLEAAHREGSMAVARNRIAEARKWLAEQKLDAVMAFNDGQNSFLDSNAVFVFTGVRALGESVVVIPRDGDVLHIHAPAWDGARVAAASAADRTLAVDEIGAALLACLAKTGLAKGALGVVGLVKQRRTLANQVLAALAQKPAANDTLASTIARIRSPEELAASRKATWIAERGYERLLEAARPGMREFELAADIYAFMKALGSEDNFLLMSASQHNLGVRAAGRRVLEKGDVILGELTPCYAGQFAQICRTAVIGGASGLQRDKYAILQKAMLRGMEAAVPGATVAEATRAMNAVLEEAGYGEYCRPPYMRVRGHGLGVTSDRPGDLHDQSEVKFEEGMIFVMHPNQYIPETGYLMCGEPVVISHNGAISLSERDSTLDAVNI
jgi:Xaa-Pro dipeptidase